MKRAVCFLTLAIGLVGLIVLSPQATLAQNNRAFVINDLGCAVPDGSGAPFATTDSHFVLAFSANGSTLAQCSATGVPNTTGKSVRWNFANTGAACQTFLGPTTNWQAVVTPSGNATIVCRTP